MGYFEEALAFLEQDPPEHRQPACPDQVFHNGNGQVTVRSLLHDPYQAGLVKAGWLERLVARLRTYPELVEKTLVVQLRPTYNRVWLHMHGYPFGPKDEENQGKNRFLLEVNWVLPPSSPMDVRYNYEILYSPRSRQYAFEILCCEANYLWKPGDAGGDLLQRLLDAGILREVVVGEPDRKLASVPMSGTLDRPEFVLVEKRKHLLSVAIDDPASFPAQLDAWKSPKTVVEPVLVRDRRQLEAFRDALYRGLEVTKTADFFGYTPAPDSGLKELDSDEMSRVLSLVLDGEHYHVHYFNAWGGGIDVRLSRLQVVVSSLGMHGILAPGVWDTLQNLARDERIWQPAPDRAGLDGDTWTLRRTGPDSREVSLWCPDAGPLVEFCFQLLKLAGLELDIKRYVRWHEPGRGPAN